MHVRCFGHEQRRDTDHIGRGMLSLELIGGRPTGRMDIEKRT